jgi:surface antigen/LysM repeat protein
MSTSAAGSESNLDSGLPLTPGSHKNPFEPTFNALGAPLQAPLDSSRSTDALLGKQAGQPVDDLTGIPSSDIGGVLSSLQPPEPVYGDEFRSGILPIDIAAHQMGSAMDKVEAAATSAIDSVISEASEAAQTFISETRKSWESPDNAIRQNLSSSLEGSLTKIHSWVDRLSNNAKVKEASERLSEQTGETLYNMRRGLESLQDKAEILLSRIQGQTEFVGESDQLATGIGSSGTGAGSTLERPDLTAAAYTSDNIYAQSGVAPASISSNSRLGEAKGNCTWYANGRAEELGADPGLLDVMRGNAYDWDNEAQAAGITISDRPQPGMVAIAQWENGHVAVVESDNGDGTVTISESSYDPGGRYDYLYGTRTISVDNPDRFILIPKVSSVSESPAGDTASEATVIEVTEANGTREQVAIAEQNYQWTPYTVSSGDTLSQIAQDTTGNAANYKLIAEHNGITNPNLIRAGQVIEILQAGVDTPENQVGQPEGTSGTSLLSDEASQVIANSQPVESVPHVITVQAGDTLTGIALQETGDASNYKEIAVYNNIIDPNRIFPEQQIKIPQSLVEENTFVGDIQFTPSNTLSSQADVENISAIEISAINSPETISISTPAISSETEPSSTEIVTSAEICVDIASTSSSLSESVSTENPSLEQVSSVSSNSTETSKRFTVVNTNHTLSLYEVPKNAVDTVASWFGNNKESETLFVTSSGLILDEYQTQQNSDGSVTVKTTIFNKYVFDALVEIYDEQGQLVRTADGVIEANTSPEHLLEAGSDLFTSQTEVMGRNITDIRNNLKSSKLEFTLKPGEHADIAIDSVQTFFYNTLVATLDFLNNLPDWTEWKIDSKEKQKVLLEFIKTLSQEGQTEVAKDSLLAVFSSPSSWSDKFGSQPVRDLLADFGKYLAETAANTAVDQGVEFLSEQIQDKGIYLLSPGVANAAKVVFNVSKAANVAVRMNNVRTIAAGTIAPTRLELESY